MRFDIITIFPQMFGSVFSGGVIGKALEKGIIEIKIHDLRAFAPGKHRQVDDRPFGGKQGMVLKPEPIFSAVETIRVTKESPVVLLSPQGRRFDSRLAKEFASVPQICIICGRYEGVDERVNDFLATHEVSIGDYVLTGGEPAAVVLVDAVSRFIPRVVGKIKSVQEDSFFDRLLDHPQYTRPRDFRSMQVPEILFSGDHNKIESWRKKKALEKTAVMRPDLVGKNRISPGKKRTLDEKLRERKD
ncbi:MAG: tRNA (guanosine(37)-N1)-methyltransferase TrmD [Candidatus Aminicenantes bacterium]|nr:tRNA (guanosine(37)-N1)-methyltransferase TrmD [Candidatus Aminicenantes bacterium]